LLSAVPAFASLYSIAAKSAPGPPTVPIITSAPASDLNYLPDCRFVGDGPTSGRRAATGTQSKNNLANTQHKDESYYRPDSFGHKLIPSV
jgi:hypothetical protein